MVDFFSVNLDPSDPDCLDIEALKWTCHLLSSLFTSS